MIHFGDITKISGYDVPIVDCACFGAPCQDLSVAGLRKGMKHENLGDDETTRSGLFHEAIRIIKEMRNRDESNGRTGEFIRPRFAIYENVPGAFSSNKGQDFRIVLESLAQVIDKDAVIPMPPKDKWSTSGAIVGEGWSIAWRVFDAQFWGVPQRRKRISLIADFGGGCAPEILFERQSLRGHFEESGTQREGTSSDVERGIGADDREGACYGFPLGFRPENVRCYEETATTLCNGTRAGFCNGVITLEPGIAAREGGHIYEGVSGTLRANAGDNQMSVAYSVENHPNDSRVKIDDEGKVQALTSRMGTGGGNVPMVMIPFCKSARARTSEDATTWKHADVANTLNVFDQGEARANELVVEEHPVICLQGNGIDRADTAGCNGRGWNDKSCYTLNTIDRPAVAYAIDQQGGKGGANYAVDVMPTLCSDSHGTPHGVAYEQPIAIDRAFFNQGKNARYDPQTYEDGTNPTLVAKGPSAVAYIDTSHADDVVRLDYVTSPLQARDYKGGKLVQYNYIVRRLTPLECERLQGYPDGWTDIGEYIDSNGKKKKTSDSARYKALGNSIALPPWKWVLKRLCSHYERDATMASLFDGIGGFPYLWEQLNGKGSCLWASEIDDFPIAVTKVRIG